MGPGHPFPDGVDENNLEQAILIENKTSPSADYSLLAGKECWSVAWSPDGRYLAWSCGNRIVKLIPWDRVEHKILRSNNSSGSAGNLAPCKEVHIDAGDLVFSVAFGSKTTETKPHSTSLNWFRYKAAKELILATGLWSGRIRLWDVYTGSLYLELMDHRSLIRDLQFAPDGSLRLVSASRDGTLKVWDLHDDGNMVKTLRTDIKDVLACAWSPNSKLLCSVGVRKSVTLWDMDSYTVVKKFKGHHHDVCACDFSPDGALLVTSSYDTRVIIWNVATGSQMKELCHMFPAPSPIFAGGNNGSFVNCVSISHDGMHVSTVAYDGYLRFWDLKSSSDGPLQIAAIDSPVCCVYSPDGSCVAVGTLAGSLSLWLAPMRVLSLQHCCRMAIRRLVSAQHISCLGLPKSLQLYLEYFDLLTTDNNSDTD